MRRPLRLPIPKSRDPFVNAPLVPVGAGKDGRERFWISSVNMTMGSLGVLVDEDGGHRIYRFKPNCGAIYSAVAENPDTLWLCGYLDFVIRLTLSTGKMERFATGAPSALVFQGMALDRETGKLFAFAYPSGGTTAFSFDTKVRKAAKVHEGFTGEHYMRFGFPNGDGTWSFVAQTPGLSLVRWDPQGERVEAQQLDAELDLHRLGLLQFRLICGERGRWYFPERGWYNPQGRAFDATVPRPEREMMWFARSESHACGARQEEAETLVGHWELANGRVENICRIADGSAIAVALTAKGKLVSVNRYGVFQRFDAASGALEASKELPTDAVGRVDCLVRIDKRRLLGTPFITQRFWEADLKTKRGFDCGRAAPGGGQITRTWKIGKKIYFAAYAGGELVEFDPARPARFPENPRTVAKPPHGMRPIAEATDGRRIYYACSAPYGKLGGVVAMFDTRTGCARYAENPVPLQAVYSLGFDRSRKALLAGTTIHADCQSAPVQIERACLVRLDAENLAVQAMQSAPTGTESAAVLGPLGPGRWLVRIDGKLDGRPIARWGAVAIELDAELGWEAFAPLPEGTRQIVYAGKPAQFVLRFENRVELWDARAMARKKVLLERIDGYRILVQDGDLFVIRRKDILVFEKLL